MKLGHKTLFFLILAVLILLVGITPSAYAQTCTDNDGDGYFSQGGTCGLADCDDNDPAVKPGAAEICDGKDTNCDGWKPSTDVDADGDGVPKCKSDCDDSNPLRYPGKAEVCDGIDNDCNSVVPANEKDNDADGYRVCQGDCADTNAAINPGVNESGTAMCSDTKDNDCDGLIDNNDPPCQTCTDVDGDGYGNPGSTFCTVGSATDCNDNNAAIKPNAVEVCDGIDNNCSGAVDEGFDADGDGFTTCNGDCNDNNAAIKPNAVEACNGTDDNCNGTIDDGFDVDGDGYTTCNGDCDDTRAGVNPGAVEIPYNGLNDDCNPLTKDDDLDGDGYPAATDCNDNNAGINPAATDIPYDGIDQDCSGSDFTDVDGDGYNSTVVAGGADCDDNNAAINPAAADAACNGLDENCTGTNDEQYVATATNCGVGQCVTTGLLQCSLGVLVDNCTPLAPGVEGPANDPTCYDGLDNNCDGLTDDPNDPNCITVCEDKDGDGVGVGADCVGQTDCNDNNAAVRPGAVEVCNAIDDNCNGTIDEGFDNDADGYTTCAGDCNDSNAGINPGAAEIPYDGIDQNCNGSDMTDVDGDGYNSTAVAGGTDCNDNNANINPGKAEIPYDGIDQNCNGSDLADVDGDGHNSTAVAGGTDCNDNDANINPGKAEVCNSKDDNCNGSTDEGFDADGDNYKTCTGDCDDTNPAIYPGAFELCDGKDNNCDGTSDTDADNDGYPSCNPQECNDNNAAIHPGATEVCNGKDDNCNGSIDEGFDADNDGYTTCNGDCDDTNANVKPGAVDICDGKDTNCDGWKSPTDVDKDGDGVPVCASDCDDNNPNRYPGKVEICDGIDNDCNYVVPANEADSDGDGYRGCQGDCKDSDANVNPGLNETGALMCSDNKDNDCDGLIDNNDPPCQTCTDVDGDGYGNPGSTFCTVGSATDCNDNNAAIKPNAVEVCDGIDNNCSGAVDEGFDADGDGFTTCNGDCNDNNAAIKPNAVEACNGTDDNCNGTIDDGFDVDGDGYTTCNGDCDDTRAGVNPGAAEIPYNGLNDDCNPLTKDDDLDGDGYPGATDCNDNNAGINPAATDIPYDGIDQDCSGSDFTDVDGDGYNSTVVAGGADCDDNNAAINPAAADAVCNGLDENCTGTNDEQYVATATNCGVGQCVTTGLLQCSLGVLVDNCTPLAPGVEGPANDPTCYDGLDNNCDGLTDDPNDPNCITVCEDKDGDGVGVGADCVGQTDCNDNNAAVRPGAVEVCNAIDDNCNGTIDEGFDNDADGYTTCAGDCNDSNAGINPGAAEIPYDGIDQNCNGSDMTDVDGDGYNSTAVAGGTDCNDNNANINPGKAEIPYDGIDQNCNGSDLADVDGDGHNSTAVAGGTDCNDNDANINPGKAEVCNSKDDNCNGATDEGFDADGDNYKTCTGDCDDTNPAIYPGAFELCDGKDNNCDGTSDTDADNDGYPSCNPQECNDNDANINPGKAEVCNSKDDNCNGSIDEGFDADGDGYTTCNGDCDDTNANVKPGAVDICDGKDTNCDGWKSPTDVDKDGDGVPMCASDCDDNNPLRYPGKAEICDGIDNDCNFVVPANEVDSDADGYRPCDTPGDCNNNNAAINPGVSEVGALCIDNKDNDCDGLTDINDLGCAAFCVDNDNDGYGNPGNSNCANGPAQDCNDSNANINPGKAEICNDIDENCNGTIDEGFDVDGDGYKTCTGDCNDNSAAVNPGAAEIPYNGIDDDCKPSTKDDDLDADGYPVATDCNDNNAAIHPGAVEIPYDGTDQDCSGSDLKDVDGDGYNSTVVAGGTDCNDNNASIKPGAAEICNGIDENCNGTIDDGFDADSDGVTSCGGDCNDNNAAIYPGAADAVCDGVDNNCSGTPDEGYTPTPTTCGTGICASTGQSVCQAGVVVDTCTAGTAQTEGPAGNATCADGLDNDCDGLTDNPADGDCVNACVDTDNDGYGDPGHAACSNGPAKDCNNSNVAIYPGAVEVCNTKDDNCDGTIDEGFDSDGDGYTTCGGDCNDGNTGINPGAAEIPYDGIDQNCNGSDLTDVDGDGYNSTAVAGGTDCNDSNANINPGKAEIPYDGIDQNCNGSDLTDVDGDGYNSTAVAGGTDCNDSNANINPGKAEACNSIDDNCNNSVDEGFDLDGDGITSCSGDCDDINPNTYPGAAEICDGRDNNCDGTSDLDADNDGYPACNPQECNDNNAAIHPGAAELCNSKDDNCNGSIDEGFDADADGYTTCGGDCDDTDPKVKPGAAEICDGKDSNCDGWKPPTDKDNDHDGVPLCASDCNDNDPARYPGNREICDDLIDNDCDNKVDAVDPDCQYTCTTKTTPHNGAHYFDLLNPADNSVIKTPCNWCHFDSTGTIDQRYLCQRCHADPADTSDPMNGTLKQQYPLARPYGFGTAKNVKQHSSGTVGTKYGGWDASCLNCHNPHTNEQNNSYGTTYGKLIKEYVCYDNAATGLNVQEVIKFTSNTGAGSFADGVPYNQNICNMCHTQTNHQQRDGTAPGGQSHYDGDNCMGCHSHDGGFKPFAANVPAPHNLFNCTVCHDTGTYVAGANILNTKCQTCHDQTAPGTSGGGSDLKVDRHFGSSYTDPTTGQLLDTKCVECHNPMSTQSNLKFIRSTVRGNPVVFTAYSGANSFADGGAPYNGICEVCHMQTNHHRNDGSAPLQSHNDGSDCRTCHKHIDGLFPSSATVPAPHNTAACTACHTTPDTYVANAAIPNSACNTCHGIGSTGGSTIKLDTHFGSTYNDPTTGAALSAKCVECHNPMSVQTNLKAIRSTVRGNAVVFTALTGAGSFADGSAPYNGICEVCHTQTNHHRNTGINPGGAHNNGTNCTTCHTHSGGFSDQNTSVTVPAPHNTAACTACHTTPDTYVANAAIPNSACNTCHGIGSTGGSTIKLDTHFGSTYNDPTTGAALSAKCVECHNPMSAQSNLKAIRSTVRGNAVVFTALTGAGSFADGSAPYNGICEVCHTQTNHHRNTGINPGGAHNNGTNCTTCHTHGGGFSDQNTSVTVPAPHNTAACTACHTTPDTYVANAAIPNSACNTCHGIGSTGGSTIKLDTHFGSTYNDPTTGVALSAKCVECHNPMSTQTNLKAIRSTVRGNAVVFTALTGAGSFADGSAPYNGICEVCHTQTNHHRNTGINPGGAHNNGTNCTTCHTHGGGFSDQNSSVTVPAPHNTAACTACHTTPDTYVANAAIPNSACNTCHGIGSTGGSTIKLDTHFGSTYNDPTTGAALSAKCVECHNPMSVQTNLKAIRSTVRGNAVVFTALTGAGSFADGSAPYNGICEVCHTQTNHHRNTGINPGGAHNNGTNCTTCHTHGGGFSNQNSSVNVPAPHNTAACTACHTTPDTYVANAAIPNSACLGCHDPAAPAGHGLGGSDLKVDTHFGSTYNDPTTGAALSAKCVECHNPMSVQTNLKAIRSTVRGNAVVFTALTGAGSFADGSAPYNGICEVCHTQTNHHRNTGINPGGAHNNGTNCTTCHTHGGGFSDQNTSVTVPAPHNTAACTACHTTPDTYVANAAIPNSACNTCHGIGSTGGSTIKLDTHFGSTYNDPTTGVALSAKCVECHNPMSTQTNLKAIRSTVRGNAVVFTALTGAGSFADGSAPYNGICEVCHTQTNHHRNTGINPGGAHNNGTNCTTCHTHGGGFSDQNSSVTVPAPHNTAACTACHTTPDTYVANAAIPNSACNTCHGIGSTGGSTIKLDTHFGSTYNDPTTGAALSAKCVECHNPMSVQTNLKAIRSTVRGNAVVFTALTGAGSFADGSAPYNGICEVCHTQTNHHRNTGINPGGAHNNGTNCTTCHTHGGGFSNQNSSVNVPAPHNTAACTACHTTPDTYVANAAIPNSACLGCHDPAAPAGHGLGGSDLKVDTHFGSTYNDPTTGAALSAKCVECHNPMSVQSNLKAIRSTVRGNAVVFTALTGAGSFADGGAPYNGICEVCHTQTNHHRNTGINPGGAHNNGTNCTTCHTHGGGFSDQNTSVTVPAPHNTAACTACHTTPDTYVANAAIPNSACNTCHGIGSTGGSTIKLDTHFESTYNDPTTGAALSAKCVECHNPMSVQTNLKAIRSTVRGNAVVFTALTGAGSFADGSAPYNGICEVCHTQTNHHRNTGINPGGAHNNGTNCTTCHTHGGGFSNQNSSVTVPAPHNTAACTACHTTPDTYVANAAIPNSACNTCHGIGSTGGSTLKLDTHFGSTYNDPTTGIALSAKCVECHNPMSAQSNLKLIRSMVRGNAVVFTALTGAGSYADGDAIRDGICEVCHTQTNHHQADGTAPGGQSHNNGANCTTCHSHLNGFNEATPVVPAPHNTAACTACHTTPDTYVANAAIPNSACNTCHGIGSTGGSTLKLDTHFGSTYNDPTTGAALSAKCVECHNPMSVQSNLKAIRSTVRGNAVVFTALTGAGSFADGGAPYNGICEVCHTQTNHHRNTGINPGGAHNNGTNCTTCHTHGGGFSDQNSSVTVPAPHNTAACTACHTTPDTYVANAAIPNSACNTCHGIGSTGGSTIKLDTHFGSTYNDPTTGVALSAKCVECHNPMSVQTNLKAIRSTVRGNAVVFTALTGAGSFADGSAPYNGICEVCHTQTNHHRNTGINPGGAHNNGTNCTTCHTHGGGFSDQNTSVTVPAPHNTAACTACHTTPDTYVANAAIPNSACNTCHGIGSTGGSTIKLDTHFGSTYNDPTTGVALSAKCVECHNPMSTQTNLKAIRSTVRGNAVVFTALTGAGSFADGSAPYNGICEVCHTQTNHHRNTGINPGGAHNNGTNCTTCHTHGGGFSDQNSSVTVPAPHNTAACTACHTTPDTYVANAAIPNSACNTCHGIGSTGGSTIKLDTHFGSTYNDPTTGVALSAKCVECHNPMSAQSNLKAIRSTVRGNAVVFTALTGAGSFADGSAPYNGICEVCHTQTNHHRNTGINPGGAHNNGTNCTTCHTHGGGFSDQNTSVTVPAPHNTAACTACHTTPDTYVANAAIPNSACNTCHGIGSTGGSTIKLDTHFGSTYNDPTTGVALSAKCVECHNPMSTQTNLKFIRSTVRGNAVVFTALTGAGSFADGSAPYNGICEVCHTQTNHHRNTGINPGGAHNNGTNCTTCHTHSGGFSDQNTSVTVPAPHNTAACTACHTTPDTYVANAAIPNSACNTCHGIGSTGGSTIKLDTHFGSTYNDPTTGAALSAKCVECHNPMSAQSNLKAIRSTVRGNAVVFTALTGAGSFADGSAPYNGICEVCHTQTNHHRNTGINPGGAHNNGTNCTTCHTHGGGFSDQNTSVTVPAPHNTAACTACHTTPDTYVANAAIPNSACNTCHGIGSTGGSTIKLDTHFGSTYNDPTTGVALSAKCVECHNPMSTQTNLKAIRSTVRGNAVVFTALTGAGSFADGSAPYNGICEVCHTQTNHHRNTGINPGGAHNNGTNCTTCHTHGGGFSDQNSSVTVPAPHNTAACTACHTTPDTYVANAAIPNSACNTCHGIGSTGGSTIKLDTHFGSTYNDPTTGAALSAKCVECHNPMSVQTNLKAIRSTVRGNAVVFTALTGAGSFADGSAPYNGICEVCHTQTNHHRNTGINPGGAHNNGTNCTTCHTHGGGFSDQNTSVTVPAPHNTAACTACHTTPDTYVANAAIPNSACNTCHGIGSTGGSTIKLDTHFGSTYNDPTTGAALSAKCVECHNPMSVQTNLKAIRSTVRGNAVVFTALTGAGSFADGSAPYNGICEVCHTQTNHHRNTGINPGGAHNNGTNCTTCHTHGGGFSDQNTSVTVPAPHNTAACTACHTTPDTYVANAAIPNSACNTCHGIGSTGGSTIKLDTHFGSTYNDPTTGAALSAKCVECHNPMSVQTNLKAIRSTVRGNAVVFTALTGAGSFADGSAPYNGICEVCHTQTNHHRNTGINPGGAHNNGTNCTTCHTHGGGFSDQNTSVTVPAPHNTAACTACHTTPDTYVANAAIPNSACNTCHGIGSTGGSTIKLDTHFGSTYNDPTTGAALSAKCVECHNPMSAQSNLKAIRSTVRGNAVVFTALTGAGSFADGSAPYNGICEVCHTQTNHHRNTGINPGGAHNNGTNCTTCHTHGGGFSDQNTSVTVPAPHNTAACTACHTTPDTYVANAVIPNTACNTCHGIGSTGGSTIKLDTHFGSTYNDPTTGVALSAKCVECHNPMSVQTNLKAIRSTVRGNAVVFTALTGAGSFADGSAPYNGICEVCHTQTNHHRNTGINPGGAHNNGTNCTTCHTHGGGFSDQNTSVTVPAPHNTAACTACHTTPDTYVANAVIPNTACMSCHNGTGSTLIVDTHFGSTYNDPTTGAALSAKCVECHNPMSVQSNLKAIRSTVRGNAVVFTALTGAGSFADGGAPYNGICEVCHTQTNHHQADGIAPGGQSHNDGADCTACHTHGGGFSDQNTSINVPAPHNTAACTVCHSSGIYTNPVTNADCLSCHDSVAPGSGVVANWGACRTETGTASIPGGSSAVNVTLTTPVTDMFQAFLLVDSAGSSTVEQGQNHMVTGDILDINTLAFDRVGTSGQAEISYTLVECFNNELNVQSGEILLANGAASNTGTIAAVDPTRSIVIVNSRTDRAAAEQYQAHATGELTNGTTVQVRRAATATSANTTVRYQVVEFSAASGAFVQTGEAGFNGGQSTTATLGTAVDLTSSWLYFSYDATSDGPQQTTVTGQITAMNTLTFTRHAANTYNNRIRYYAVEFPTGEVIVKRGASSYTGGTATATHNIGFAGVSAVNKAFAFVSNTTADTGGTGGSSVVQVVNPWAALTTSGTGSSRTATFTAGAGTNRTVVIGVGYESSSTTPCSPTSITGNYGGQTITTINKIDATGNRQGQWMGFVRETGIAARTNDTVTLTFNGCTPDTAIAISASNYQGVSQTATPASAVNSGTTGTAHSWTGLTVVANGYAMYNVSGNGTHTYTPPTGYTERYDAQASAQFERSAGDKAITANGTESQTVTASASSSRWAIVAVSLQPSTGTVNAYPRNRWTERLSSTTNILMSNWRGDTTGANANFEYQVVEFTGGPVLGSGSNLKVDRHFSDNYIDPTTGVLANINCVECHNPMSAQSNLKLIRSTIRGNSVVFTAYSGAGSFADGGAIRDGICEVCHTQTNHHQADGVAPGGQSHNDGTDCRTCHAHIDGFIPNVAPDAPHNSASFLNTNNCNYCHVTNTDFVTKVPDTKCSQCHTASGALKVANPAEFGLAPDVVTHNTANGSGTYTYSNDCVDCHNVMFAQTNAQHIRSTLAGSRVPGSNIVFTAFTGPGSFADGAPYPENVCDTCHSLTQHHQSDGIAPGGQDHNNGTDCAGCHPHAAGFQPQGGCTNCHDKPQPNGTGDYRRQIAAAGGELGSASTKVSHHVNGTLDDATCEVCHDQSNHQANVDPGVLLNDPDGGASVAYSGTASQLTPVCLNCHDANGAVSHGGTTPFSASADTTTPPNVAAEWNLTYGHRAAGVACMECHGNSGGTAGLTTNPKLNGHASDTINMLQYTYSATNQLAFCANTSCHGSAAAAWGTGNINYEFTTGPARHPIGTALPTADRLSAAQLAGGWTPGQTMTCSNCHDTAGGAAGPHGSTIKWMLAGTNKAWPYTTAAGNGGTTGTFRQLSSRTTSSGTDNGLFCINCHPSGNANNAHSQGNHSSVQCVGCHIRVPHGGKIQRFFTTNTAGLPARYKPNGAGAGWTGTNYLNRILYTTSENSYGSSGQNCNAACDTSRHNNTTGAIW